MSLPRRLAHVSALVVALAAAIPDPAHAENAGTLRVFYRELRQNEDRRERARLLGGIRSPLSSSQYSGADALGVLGVSLRKREQERQAAQDAYMEQLRKERLARPAFEYEPDKWALEAGFNAYWGENGKPQNFAAARQGFVNAANHGSVEGMFWAARMMRQAQGGPLDNPGAAHWFGKAARQGHAESMHWLAVMLLMGDGVPADADKAESLLVAATQAGNRGARQMFEELEENQLLTTPRSEEAIFRWQLLRARKGAARNQYYAGLRYLAAQGVAPDRYEAEVWLRHAAAQGHREANAQVGYLLVTGGGAGPERSAEGLGRLRQAAEQGSVEARSWLGALFLEGTPWIPEQPDEALRWIRPLAEAGHGYSSARLGLMHLRGIGVPANAALGLEWLRKAAGQEVLLAQTILGDLYSRGEGVPQDPTEARRWYARAAEVGEPRARQRLAEIDAQLQAPRFSTQDVTAAMAAFRELRYAEAIRVLKPLAEQKQTPGLQGMVAEMYDRGGGGLAADRDQALLWYRRAASQGDSDAQKRLAELER